MGAGQSRSTDKKVDGRGDGSSAHARKFQSYHLPFQKKKKFAKLKERLFGKKKSKPESDQSASSTGGKTKFFLGQDLTKSTGVSTSLQALSTSKGLRPHGLSSAHSQHILTSRSDSTRKIRSDPEQVVTDTEKICSESEQNRSGSQQICTDSQRIRSDSEKLCSDPGVLSGNRSKIPLPMPSPEYHCSDSVAPERDADKLSLLDGHALFKKNEDPYAMVIKDKIKMTEAPKVVKRGSSSSSSLFEDAPEGDLPHEVDVGPVSDKLKPDKESLPAHSPGELVFEDATDDMTSDVPVKPSEMKQEEASLGVQSSSDVIFEDAKNCDKIVPDVPVKPSKMKLDVVSMGEQLSIDLSFEDAKDVDDIVLDLPKKQSRMKLGEVSSEAQLPSDLVLKNAKDFGNSAPDLPAKQIKATTHEASPGAHLVFEDAKDFANNVSDVCKNQENSKKSSGTVEHTGLEHTKKYQEPQENSQKPLRAEEECDDIFFDLNGFTVPIKDETNLSKELPSLGPEEMAGFDSNIDVIGKDDTLKSMIVPEIGLDASLKKLLKEELKQEAPTRDTHFHLSNNSDSPPKYALPKSRRPMTGIAGRPRDSDSSDERSGSLGEDDRALYTSESDLPSEGVSEGKDLRVLPGSRLVEQLLPESKSLDDGRDPQERIETDHHDGRLTGTPEITTAKHPSGVLETTFTNDGQIMSSIKEHLFADESGIISQKLNSGNVIERSNESQDLPVPITSGKHTGNAAEELAVAELASQERHGLAKKQLKSKVDDDLEDRFSTAAPYANITLKPSEIFKPDVREPVDLEESHAFEPHGETDSFERIRSSEVNAEFLAQKQIPDAMRRSSANYDAYDSSSGEQKASVSMASSNSSGSDITDDIWDEDFPNEKSAEAIKTKLVIDLLKKLEVDMGDFHTFSELPGVLEDKYHVLPFREFLTTNLESNFSLDDLSRCFRVLAKYGLNLLKAGGDDTQHWRKVIIPPKMLVGHWLCVQGSKEILMELGYVESERNLVYPEDEEPNEETTAAWVVEMLLAAHEINLYCMGSHPHPEMLKSVVQEVKGSEDDFEAASVAATMGDEEPSTSHLASSEDISKQNPEDTDLKTEEEGVIKEVPDFFSSRLPDDEDEAVQPVSSAEEAKESIDQEEDDASSDMFGRRTVVPWLMDKEKRLPEAPPQQRCHLCGSSSPAVRCEKCSNLIFCVSCDDMYHRHPKRRDHTRKAVNPVVNMPPPLPPPRPPSKNADPNKIPVPPPRRRKSQRSIPNSPVFGRKAADQKPELPKKQFPNLKFGSLKRFIPGANSNRPTPSSPKEQYPTRLGHQDRSEDAGGMLIDAKYGVGQGRLQERQGDYRDHQLPPNFPRDNTFNRFPSRSNAPEQSSSDAEEDCPMPCNMSRGSGSFVGSGPRDEQWSPTSAGPPLPPPYGGMTSRSVASLNQMGYYPEPGNSTLSRRNTMMSGTMDRSLGYGYPHVNYMQHSSSVCDLSNSMIPPPYMMGYRLPQVQSMADLQQGEMGPVSAPCGCRPNWIGPDAFGQWHPPVACLAHSTNPNAFANGTKPPQSPFHPGYPAADGMFGTLAHPTMYPMMPPSGYPQGTRSTSSNSEQRAQSPAPSAASAGSRKKPKEVVSHSRTSRRRQRPPLGTTSSEEDYFSAGESDEDEPPENALNDRRQKATRPVKVNDGSWECEHCTFINKSDTRICNVCCKTSGRVKVDKRGGAKKNSNAVADMEVDPQEELETDRERFSSQRRPRIEEKSNKPERRNPPKLDDGEYEDLDNGQMTRTKTENDNLFTKNVRDERQSAPSKPKAQNGNGNASDGPVRHGVEIATDPMDTVRHGVEVATDPMDTEGSVPASRVQSDTQTYSSVFREKILTASNASSKTNGLKNVMSKGTSPPPQSIATQTPTADVWTSPEPQKKFMGRTSSRMSLSGESEFIGSGSYHPAAASVLKRAASLHFPRSYGGGFNDAGSAWGGGYQSGSMVRSGSRSSLMSDNHFGYNLPSDPPSRDPSPPPPMQRNIISRRESNIERGQFMYPNLSRSLAQEERNTRNESRKDYYLSLEELVEKRRQETLRTQGLELVKLLREAEQQNFSADDLQVALNHCGSQNPVQWLQDNWKNMVDTVVTLATNYGNDKKKNDIGVMSSTEAKESLRLHKGNIWAAVTECVEQRQKRFAELQARGNFSRDEVVAALTSNQGNVELALEELNKASLKPFLMRIWGPPSGAENESGLSWAAMQAIHKSQNADSAKDDWKNSVPLDDYDTIDVQSFNNSDGDDIKLDAMESPSNEAESSLEEALDSIPVNDLPDNDPETIDSMLEKSEAKDEEFFDAVPGTPPDELYDMENHLNLVKEQSEMPEEDSADYVSLKDVYISHQSASAVAPSQSSAVLTSVATITLGHPVLSFPAQKPQPSFTELDASVTPITVQEQRLVPPEPVQQQQQFVPPYPAQQQQFVAPNPVQQQQYVLASLVQQQQQFVLPEPVQQQQQYVAPNPVQQSQPVLPDPVQQQQYMLSSLVQQQPQFVPPEPVQQQQFVTPNIVKQGQQFVSSTPGQQQQQFVPLSPVQQQEQPVPLYPVQQQFVPPNPVQQQSMLPNFNQQWQQQPPAVEYISKPIMVSAVPLSSELTVTEIARSNNKDQTDTVHAEVANNQTQSVLFEATAGVDADVPKQVPQSEKTPQLDSVQTQSPPFVATPSAGVPQSELNPQLDNVEAMPDDSISNATKIMPPAETLTLQNVAEDVNGVPPVAVPDPKNAVDTIKSITSKSNDVKTRVKSMEESAKVKTRRDASSKIKKVVGSSKIEEVTKVVEGSKVRSDKVKAKPVVNAAESDSSRRIRQFLAEGKLPTYERAEVAIKLIDLRFDESEAIYAARECSDLYMAVSYLQQDCELCAGKFPMGKMISMLNCIHRCCRSCAKDYYTLKIKERNIMEVVCPFCNEPNLNDDDIAVDYFNNLDIVLKNLVDMEIHELFQRKLRDRALMSDPNFLWCHKCASGFIAEPNHRRLVCPNCKVITCAECKKPWEKQHDGISCQRFLEWKQDNDPEYQMAGLERYLAENGIDCPKCKFKYALAKGGCMHFTCSQCKFEFCSGCGRPFRMAKKCGVSERCERLGLHAHHPRNCLFYLRDKEPKDLLKLLDDHGVSYELDIQCSEEEGEGHPRKCPVMEQKELPDGVEDSKCGREVEAEFPGLCRIHYIEYLGGVLYKNKVDPIDLLSDDNLEAVIRDSGRRLPVRAYHTRDEEFRRNMIKYLVSLINANTLDPVTIMDIGGLQQELRRKEKKFPEQQENEQDEQYRNKLVQLILKDIPLEENM